MRILRLCLVLSSLVVAATAAADVRVNDPTGDPAGSTQSGPSVCKVYSGSGGNQIVATWLNVNGPVSTITLSYAVSHLQPLAFVQHGTVPAPTGWHWWGDVTVRAPQSDPLEEGTFYVAGQVQRNTAPKNVGLAFARGHALDPSTVVFDPPQLLQDFGTPNIMMYFGSATFGVHPESGVLYAVYTPSLPNIADPRGLYLRRSLDGGDTWSAPALVNADTTLSVGDPQLAFGIGANEVTVLWLQASSTSEFADRLACASTDGGASFGTPTIAMTLPSGHQADPSIHTIGQTSAVVVDRWNAATQGEIVVASTFGMNMTADAFPDPAVGPSQVEIEGNGSIGTATPFYPLVHILRGTVSTAPADTDYFACPVFVGQPVSILCDSLGTGSLTVDLIGPDGADVLARTSASAGTTGTNSGRLGFAPIVDGVYWLRVTAYGGTVSYRVRIAEATTPYPSAFDQHDIGLSLLPPAGAWTGLQVQSPFTPIGSDESQVTLAAAADGGLYCAYTDFSVDPAHAISRRALRRSADGGASWSEPVMLSSAYTMWNLMQGNGGESTVRGGDIAYDGANLFFVWSDARTGDLDVYLEWISRTISMADVSPFTLTAHPGQSVTVSRTVRNDDTHEPFDVRITPDGGYYGWSLATSNATLAPGQTAPLAATFTIPPTATAGSYVIPLFYRSAIAPHVSYTSANLMLTITTPLGVDDAPHALAFAPIAPNPIAGRANFAYSLSREGTVTLDLYSVDGRRVRTLVSGAQAAGAHAIEWDARDAGGERVGPGAYFAVLHAEDRRLVRRCVVVR